MLKHLLVCCITLSFIQRSYSQSVTLEDKPGQHKAMERFQEIYDCQDSLVGYLAFTERARLNADTFSYHLLIMNNQLDSVGEFNFNEQKLLIKGAAYERGMLCIAYVKTRGFNYEFNHYRDYYDVYKKDLIIRYTQFLSMEGKLYRVVEAPITFRNGVVLNIKYRNNDPDKALFLHPMQVKAIKGIGFVCFYGAYREPYHFVAYGLNGDLLMDKAMVNDALQIEVKTWEHNIYWVLKKWQILKEENEAKEGGYVLAGINMDDQSLLPRLELKDTSGNPLKVLSFGRDPLTHQLFLGGLIVNPAYPYNARMKDLTKGIYEGVFSMTIGNSIQPVFAYWKGSDTWMRPVLAYRDMEGNTFFAGPAVVKEINWAGSIAEFVLTAPLIIPPVFILGLGGVKRYHFGDGIVMKLSPDGRLQYDTSFTTSHSRFMYGGTPVPPVIR